MKSIVELLEESLNTSKTATTQKARELLNEIRTKIERKGAYNFSYNDITVVDADENIINWTNQYMFDNNIKKKLLRIVRIAIREGVSGMLLRVGDEMVSQVVKVVSEPVYNKQEKLLEVFLMSDGIDIDKYTEKALSYMKLIFDEERNKYVLINMSIEADKDGNYIFANGSQDMLQYDNGDVLPAEYVYENIDYCPLEIFENNEERKSDWDYVKETARLYTHFNALIEQEYEYLKIQLLNNITYNPDKTGPEVQRDIEGGKRVHDTYDTDGQLQQALSYLSSGGMTTDILIRIKENYKEDIRDLTFSFGRVAGGNNKQTTEVVSNHFDALNYLYAKQFLFSSFIRKYVWKLIDMSNKLNKATAPQVPDNIEVSLQLSRALEIMLNMNGQSQEIDGQSTAKFIQEKVGGDE